MGHYNARLYVFYSILFYSTIHTTILALTSMKTRPHPNVSSFMHGVLVYSHLKPEFVKYQVIYITYFLQFENLY